MPRVGSTPFPRFLLLAGSLLVTAACVPPPPPSAFAGGPVGKKDEAGRPVSGSVIPPGIAEMKATIVDQQIEPAKDGVVAKKEAPSKKKPPVPPAERRGQEAARAPAVEAAWSSADRDAVTLSVTRPRFFNLNQDTVAGKAGTYSPSNLADAYARFLTERLSVCKNTQCADIGSVTVEGVTFARTDTRADSIGDDPFVSVENVRYTQPEEGRCTLSPSASQVGSVNYLAPRLTMKFKVAVSGEVGGGAAIQVPYPGVLDNFAGAPAGIAVVGEGGEVVCRGGWSGANRPEALVQMTSARVAEAEGAPEPAEEEPTEQEQPEQLEPEQTGAMAPTPAAPQEAPAEEAAAEEPTQPEPAATEEAPAEAATEEAAAPEEAPEAAPAEEAAPSEAAPAEETEAAPAETEAAPAEEAKAEEAKTEEAKTEEAKTEAAPAEEAKTEATPAEEAKAEAPATEQAAVAPAPEAPTEPAALKAAPKCPADPVPFAARHIPRYELVSMEKGGREVTFTITQPRIFNIDHQAVVQSQSAGSYDRLVAGESGIKALMGRVAVFFAQDDNLEFRDANGIFVGVKSVAVSKVEPGPGAVVEGGCVQEAILSAEVSDGGTCVTVKRTDSVDYPAGQFYAPNVKVTFVATLEYPLSAKPSHIALTYPGLFDSKGKFAGQPIGLSILAEGGKRYSRVTNICNGSDIAATVRAVLEGAR